MLHFSFFVIFLVFFNVVAVFWFSFLGVELTQSSRLRSCCFLMHPCSTTAESDGWITSCLAKTCNKLFIWFRCQNKNVSKAAGRCLCRTRAGHSCTEGTGFGGGGEKLQRGDCSSASWCHLWRVVFLGSLKYFSRFLEMRAAPNTGLNTQYTVQFTSLNCRFISNWEQKLQSRSHKSLTS